MMCSNIYYLQGLSAFEKGEGEKAEKLFNTALFWDDDNSDIYLALGSIYLRASKSEMEEYFRVHRKIKTVYSQPPVSLEQKKGEEIFEVKVEVKELTTKDVRYKIRKGDNQELRITKEILHSYPSYPGSAEGHEQKAVEAFRKGILLNPLDARLYHRLAEAMQFAAEPAQTQAVFRKAVELDPNNPNIHFSFSLFYLRKGMKPDGINEMRNVVSLFPLQAHKAYSEWRKYGGSINDLLSIAGASPTGLYSLGLFFEQKKYPVRAREAFYIACKTISARASFRDPVELPSHDILSLLLEKLEKYGLNKEHAYFKALWEKDLNNGVLE